MRKLFLLLLFSSLPSWSAWSNGYDYRASFVVQSGKVTGTLTGFTPVVYGTFANLVGKIQDTANCYDFIWTSDANGTIIIPFKRTLCNPATGKILFWFKPTSVTAGDTIYAFYGKTSDTDHSSPSTTWNTNYKTIWELEDNAATTVIADSADSDPGTTVGGNTTDGHTDPAMVGSGLTTAVGSIVYLYSTNAPPSGSLTLGIWIKPTNTGSQYVILTTGADQVIRVEQNSGHYRVGFGNGSSWGTTISINSAAADSTNWTHLTAVHDGTGNTTSLYINGAPDANLNAIADTISVNPATALVVGRYGGGGYEAYGIYDQLEVSDIVRSSAWIEATYNVQLQTGFWGITWDQVPGGAGAARRRMLN